VIYVALKLFKALLTAPVYIF